MRRRSSSESGDGCQSDGVPLRSRLDRRACLIHRGVDARLIMKLNTWFTKVAETVSHAAGHAVAFIICCLVILVWAACGPIFQFSDTWQLLINTGTTIVTFLMVFLIQNTQNRDGAAVQAKLDELIRVTAASNSFIGIEHLTVEEVNEFRAKCKAAAGKAGSAAVKKASAKARKAADKAA